MSTLVIDKTVECSVCQVSGHSFAPLRSEPVSNHLSNVKAVYCTKCGRVATLEPK